MQKNKRVLLIVTVVGLSVVFIAYWFGQYLLKSRASTVPAFSFAVAEGKKIAPGDSFDILVQIAPNTKTFYSANLNFTYDITKLQLKNETDLPSNITPLSTTNTSLIDVKLLTANTSIDPATGKIAIMVVRENGTNDPFIGGSTPIPLVKVSFVMKPAAALPFEFAWDESSRTSSPDTIEKQNLVYTGLEPTITSKPTDIPAVGVPTITSAPGTVQPTGAYNSLTPVPTIIGSSGAEAQTTAITERKDLLYINSIASYQSPFRYEQAIKLEKGAYSLRVGAKVYVRRERGMVIALICNESTCGAKRQGSMLYTSPAFPVKTEFSELADTITVPNDADGKEFLLRIYCEDGSECEIDYISLEDAWGSERIKNNNFEEVQKIADPRKQPSSWVIDATANLYGSIDSAFGKNGTLMINNSAK